MIEDFYSDIINGNQQQIFKYLEELRWNSKCLHTQVSAIVVNKDKISIGVNTFPKGFKCCIDTGKCQKEIKGFSHGEGHDECLAIHAEALAIATANFDLKNAILYCSHKPCRNCAKLIHVTGIKKVLFKYDYPDTISDEIFLKGKIICKKIK